MTGGKVNRGGGYGLEVPCVYRLYGPKVYIEKMRELVNSLRTAGLLYSGRTTVAEVPYMEGFICKQKSYVDAGRV